MQAAGHGTARGLLQSGLMTTVTSAQALQQAVASGAPIIQVLDHLDFTTVPLADLSRALGFIPDTVLSIQGNCTGKVANVTFPATHAPLRSPLPGQCVLLVDEADDFMAMVENSKLWIDGLYVRMTTDAWYLPATTQNASRALIEMHETSELWMTRVTLQGSGASVRNFVGRLTNVYAEDCMFAEFHLRAVFILSEANSATSMVNCTFANNTLGQVFPPGAVMEGTADDDASLDTLVRLEGVTFRGNTPSTTPTLTADNTESNGTQVLFYSDSASVQVCTLEEGGLALGEEDYFFEPDPTCMYASPEPLESAGDRFLTPSIAWFVEQVENNPPAMHAAEDTGPSQAPEGEASDSPSAADPDSDSEPGFASTADSPLSSDSESSLDPAASGSSNSVPAPASGDVNAWAIVGSVAAGVLATVNLAAAAYFIMRRNRIRNALPSPSDPLGSARDNADEPEVAAGPVAQQGEAQLNPNAPAPARMPDMHAQSAHSDSQDTFDRATWQATVVEVSHMPRQQPPVDPGPGASTAQVLEYIKQQLDCFGREPLLLDRYQLLGPEHRVTGGQGVVQFVRNVQGSGSTLFALKFFASRRDFDEEVHVYKNSPLRHFMPKVVRVVGNEDRSATDTCGGALPPFIVMEKGESLQERARNSPVDVFTAAQVLGHVSQRISDLHQAGYVHRDLKPGNIMWQPRTYTWVLIDFGLVARAGDVAPVGGTPGFVAPETAQAWLQGNRTQVVDSKVDSWALGVIAFELLVGRPAFGMFRGVQELYKQVTTPDHPLPWDDVNLSPEDKRKLGKLRRPIKRLLQREPSERGTALQLCRQMSEIFSGSMVPSVGGNASMHADYKETR